MGSDKRKRSAAQIMVRVTQDEKKEIRNKAQAYGMKAPTYLRNLGLGYEIPSGVVDQKAVLDLIRINGDLGRLGGLLKLWLTNKERFKEVGQHDIKQLHQEIEKTMKLLKQKILSI